MMAALAVGRSLSSGRAAILEWLIKEGKAEGLEIVVGRSQTRACEPLGIKYLRRYKPLPAGVKPKVEKYLDDPASEVRQQTKLTLQKLPA